MVSLEYELVLTGMTVGNLYYSDKSSTANNTALIITTALIADSIVVPWFTGGRTLHEILGVPSNISSELYIRNYERIVTAVLNLSMVVKNRRDYLRNQVTN